MVTKGVTMAELKAEIEHMKGDITEIKSGYKDLIKETSLKYSELSKDVSSMKESHMETKIYVRQIQESQSTMAKDAKNNQEKMLDGLQDLKDKPAKSWDAMSIAWKIGLGMIIITYVMGCLATVAKMLATKVF